MLYAIAVCLPTLLGIAAIGLVLLHEEFGWLERRLASRRSAGRLLRGLQSYLDRSGVTELVGNDAYFETLGQAGEEFQRVPT